MKRKLQEERGLTLVEMLCGVAILTLLGLMLNTGLQLAVRSYRTVTAQAELNLLLSTLTDVLADDLRYARNVTTNPDGTLYSYTSDSYHDSGSGQTRLEVSDGQIEANGQKILPAGVYGNGAYQAAMTITYQETTGQFVLDLTVRQTEGDLSARTGLTVRCLNWTAPEEGEEP